MAIGEKERKEKVLKFETFLNETLRSDLKAILEEREKLYEEIAEYLSLKNSIEALKFADLPEGQPLKTKVDLGCNFYAKASVKNHKHSKRYILQSNIDHFPFKESIKVQ